MPRSILVAANPHTPLNWLKMAASLYIVVEGEPTGFDIFVAGQGVAIDENVEPGVLTLNYNVKAGSHLSQFSGV